MRNTESGVTRFHKASTINFQERSKIQSIVTKLTSIL